MSAISQRSDPHNPANRAPDAAPSDLAQVLAGFEPITLAEMQSVALLDRVDTKYVMGVSQLLAALEAVTPYYRVLAVNGERVNRYKTLYFSTGDFDRYTHHHNEVGARYKVRERRYVGSDLSFLEVKHRTNQNRTVKSRIQIPDVDTRFDGLANDFLDRYTPFDGDMLEPKLWNDYWRITLVSRQRTERLTLDLNLSFRWGDAETRLPGVAIAEVKQDRVSLDSDFIQQMRRLGVRPGGISKYCAGVCLLYDNVKSNNFKPRLHEVAKVIQREMYHDRVS